MKFQYTKHKDKWNRVIKHLKKGIRQYEEFSDLERVCCDDADVISYSYACTYAKFYGVCPLDFKDFDCPAQTISWAYDKGDFEYAIQIAEKIRDLPVKEGVEWE